MDKIKRIKNLVKLLNKASDAYYNTGNTLMTDQEFDSMMEELKCFEQETGFAMSNSPTQNVGAKVKSKLEKIRHERPMLSLDKCHNIQELIDFAKDDDCFLSVKCDGLSTRLIYENGKLVSAETRGDGETGQQVLFHIEQYCNVPMCIPVANKYVIDGESVIFNSDFEIINRHLPEDEKFSNPRNLASGTLSNLDASITKGRSMRFIAWRVIDGDHTDGHFYRLKNAEKMGFTLAPMLTYDNKSNDKDQLENMLHNLKKQANEIGLPMDGIVMAKNSHVKAESMGRTSKFFRHSIAYKFDDETYETKLKYIDWTLGRTGILTPTAVFNPVEIDGAEVTRASLHNINILKELGLTNNCTVYTFKANQIIPQIRSCKNDGCGEIEIPDICPVCNGSTVIRKDSESEVLVCINPDCIGKQLARFNHFVSKKAMNIDGLSEKTLEVLLSHGFIHDFVDIYRLSGHQNTLICLDGFGKKSVEKLLKSIEDSRNVKLENFIYALGIPNIGLSAAKTISKYFNGNYERFFQAFRDCFEWTVLEDFGVVMAASLEKYLEQNFDAVQNLSKEMNFIVPEVKQVTETKFTGKSICVTGKLEHFTRESINEKIISVGAKVASSVSKKTDYLITNEQSGSSKYKKATELNIPIITEEEFLKMIGE